MNSNILEKLLSEKINASGIPGNAHCILHKTCNNDYFGRVTFEKQRQELIDVVFKYDEAASQIAISSLFAACKNRGYGTKLMVALENFAREANCFEIVIPSSTNHRFYIKNGYVQTSERKMKKELNKKEIIGAMLQR